MGRREGVAPPHSLELTVLRLELGSLHGEVVEHSLGLFGLGPVLIHLVFKGPAHLLQVSLEPSKERSWGRRHWSGSKRKARKTKG